MNPEIEALFEAARKLRAPEARQAFLDAACAKDPQMRRQLEELLATQGEADELFESGAAAMRAASGIVRSAEPFPLAAAEEQPGDRIGRYRLQQKIGEGGCGLVYMAEQEEPLRRRVALKIIKLGMDTKSVVARFEAERQALAMMDHPNIAKVLDGGATGMGRPYFVMELVRGIKITEYCDENQLSMRDRLELFMRVCQAVQHAHQKGIIHRDLKPSNILVTVNDGVAVPKVIDFGVAKAIEQKLTDKTLFTAFEQVIGTPAYMSPEQAAMTSLDIDTRSDIYSLGVLLYELLTGKTPFDPKALVQGGVDEMRRTIRENDPPRPSACVKTLAGEALTTTAKRRGTEAPKLIHLLRGDLDWIAMKCLEKDRTRRYETASGLATDVKHFLQNEPVVARPPGNFYRLQKWVRRNRLACAAGAALVATLLFGLGLTTWFLIRTVAAEREQGRLRAKAERAERDGLEKLRESHLAQARANRRSPLAGRRLQSLEVVRKAAVIPVPGEKDDATMLSLRNETIACLALPDLAESRLLRATNSRGARFKVDAPIERYALVDETGAVYIRRIATDEELVQLPAVTNGVSSVPGFSPDGRLLAVVFRGCHLRVWDLEQRAVTLALEDKRNFREVVFAPDSRTVAVIPDTADGSLFIYDLATGRLARTLKAGSPLLGVCFSADGAYLAIVPNNSSTVEILEMDSGRSIVQLSHSMPVHAVAWHPDNRLLAVGNQDLHVHLWNPLTGQKCGRLAGHRNVVAGVAFHPDGRVLASASWDGTTKLWDVSNGEQFLHFGTSGSSLQFSRDGRRLAMLPWDGGRLLVCDSTVTRVCRGLVDLSSGPDSAQSGGYFSAAFSPDERFLVAAGRGGVHLWSLDRDRSIDLPPLGEAFGALIHPRRNELIITQGRGLSRWGLDAAPGQASLTVFTSRTPNAPSYFGRTAISRSGALLACANQDSVYLEREGRSPLRLTGPSTPNILAISPNERWLAAGTWPGRTTSVWDTDSGERLRDFDTATPDSLAFSPDNRWLVIATAKECAFYDVKTGERGRSVSDAGVRAVAFSHDGRLLAMAVNNLVRLLDAATFEEVATLETPSAPMVAQVVFSPSNTQLAVVGGGQTVQLWDLRALRAELAGRKLDWTHPPPPPAPALPAPTKVIVRPLIPARPSQATARAIDLTPHYTAALTDTWGEPWNHLAELRPGLHTFGDIEYDIRGSIHLRGGNYVSYPSEVTGIQIRQRARHLHFLGAVGLAPVDGSTVATNRIHYVDGVIIDVPVVVGRETANWWFRPGASEDGLDVAWRGGNGKAKANGYEIRLLHSVWTNPRPDVAIKHMDYISSRSQVVPFIVAITVE